MMNSIKEARIKVVSYLTAKGPSLPVELTKVMGVDTLTSNAILSSLVKSKVILRTHKKIGSSYIYYLKGQEEAARRRIYETLSEKEKALVDKIRRNRVIFDQHLSKEEHFLIEDLLDFVEPIEVRTESGSYLAWKYYSATEDEVREKIAKVLEELKQVRESVESKAKVKEAPIDPEEKIREFLTKIGARIIESSSKRKEKEYLVEVPEKFGTSKLLVKFKDKKSIDERDMSLLHTEILKRKLPILLIISGKLSKKAREFKEKNLGELVKVFRLDDL